jgi:hypothetical protein
MDAEKVNTSTQETEHQSCLRCGYDLHAHANTERCPECGHVIDDVVILVGFDSAASYASRIVLILILLIVAMFFWFVAAAPICMAPFLVAAAQSVFFIIRRARSRAVFGGDLRWVVDYKGIRAIRAQGQLGKLLPWKSIRKIKVNSSFSIAKKRWRALRVVRPFLHIELFRTRIPKIWFKPDTVEKMAERRLAVLSQRPDSEVTHSNESGRSRVGS